MDWLGGWTGQPKRVLEPPAGEAEAPDDAMELGERGRRAAARRSGAAGGDESAVVAGQRQHEQTGNPQGYACRNVAREWKVGIRNISHDPLIVVPLAGEDDAESLTDAAVPAIAADGNAPGASAPCRPR